MHYNGLRGERETMKTMATLTVTGRGQVTLKKDLLQHMGIEPGGKVEVDKLPDGKVVLRAERRKRPISELFGILAGKTKVVATIEEINGATGRVAGEE
jgi:antitoxin PrlF